MKNQFVDLFFLKNFSQNMASEAMLFFYNPLHRSTAFPKFYLLFSHIMFFCGAKIFFFVEIIVENKASEALVICLNFVYHIIQVGRLE